MNSYRPYFKSKLVLISVLIIVNLSFGRVFAQSFVSMQVTVPAIDADPYFRPYVAVWMESAKREPTATFALWYQTAQASEDGTKWLKDLRQWWRRIGRNQSPSYEAVTGASRKAGRYQIDWTSESLDGGKLMAGDYFICVEAAREEGGRSFVRIPVSFGGERQENSTFIASDKELGEITVHWGERL